MKKGYKVFDLKTNKVYQNPPTALITEFNCIPKEMVDEIPFPYSYPYPSMGGVEYVINVFARGTEGLNYEEQIDVIIKALKKFKEELK